MPSLPKKVLLFALFLGLCSIPGLAEEHRDQASATGASEAVCKGFGPQTPRDIDSSVGENPRAFSFAPSYRSMNLCNIHFHFNAEHKAKDFSIAAGEGEDGYGGGYRCNASASLSESELRAFEGDVCKGLEPGDTIEVHWVYSSCAVAPGKGLGSCLSDSCGNPDLRVETQVFTLVNDSSAVDFGDFAYDGHIENGYHQAKALPAGTGEPVQFLGSTTGPKYSEQVCSPLQVSWSVRPRCAKLDIASLAAWCGDNVFEEDHAHGVRELVTNPLLLSRIE